MAFEVNGHNASAYNRAGKVLWTRSYADTRTANSSSGGFDFDADGWPDFGYSVDRPTGTHCPYQVQDNFDGHQVGNLYGKSTQEGNRPYHIVGAPGGEYSVISAGRVAPSGANVFDAAVVDLYNVDGAGDTPANEGSIVVQMTEMGSYAGIALRASPPGGDGQFLMLQTFTNLTTRAIIFRYRKSDGTITNLTNSVNVSDILGTAYRSSGWLRVDYKGAVFNAYVSTDGINWVGPRLTWTDTLNRQAKQTYFGIQALGHDTLGNGGTYRPLFGLWKWNPGYIRERKIGAYVFISGRTGTRYQPLTEMLDYCYNGKTGPQTQWIPSSIMFGKEPGWIFATPNFATTSWILRFVNGGFTTYSSLYNPSTVAFDSYAAANVPAFNTAFFEGDKKMNTWWEPSNVGNGMIVDTITGQAVLFFTEQRAVRYDFSPTYAQLIRDDILFPNSVGYASGGGSSTNNPYHGGGLYDDNYAGISGRSLYRIHRMKGIVMKDPGQASNMYLINGTWSSSLLSDTYNAELRTRKPDPQTWTDDDEWDSAAHVMRHIVAYTWAGAQGGSYGQRHYSNLLWDGYLNNRVSYPAHPLVKRQGASRLAYNVLDRIFFDGLRWYLHISMPGSTQDLYALENKYLWDIKDLDGDGIDEWVVSSTNEYFPDGNTSLYHWNETTLQLDLIRTYNGVLPVMPNTYYVHDRRTSDIAFFEVQSVNFQASVYLAAKRQSDSAIVLCSLTSNDCIVP